eukprot:3785126-Prorocentrum_lima.AAC.1
MARLFTLSKDMIVFKELLGFLSFSAINFTISSLVTAMAAEKLRTRGMISHKSEQQLEERR